MTRERDTGLPDVILERYRLGELPEREAAHVDERLRADASLRLRLEELEASDREIGRRYPPGWLAERIRERLHVPPSTATRPARAWTRQWALPATLAAAVVTLLVLAPRTFGPPPIETGVPSATPGSPERLKGLKPSLTLFGRTPDGSETLADGAAAHQGDQIRIGYRSAGRPYGAILSVDGRGTVTVHLAADGTHSAPLRHGETVLLDQAFELDDAPLWERFYFVVAERPFALAPIVEAVRQAASQRTAGPAPPLALPSQYQQFVVVLRKEVRS